MKHMFAPLFSLLLISQILRELVVLQQSIKIKKNLSIYNIPYINSHLGLGCRFYVSIYFIYILIINDL